MEAEASEDTATTAESLNMTDKEIRLADSPIRQLGRLGVEVLINPYLGEITAPADLETAAVAWAEGEILNIELYNYLLSMTDDTQLTKV